MADLEYREVEPLTSQATRQLQPARRHWPLITILAAAGAGLGVGLAFLIPITYTAEARVAVGAGDLTSGAISGFPLAASQLASNYARYVNDRGVAGTDVPEGVKLSASQIPDSNIIRVEAESRDGAAATAAANSAAQELVDTVNSGGAESAAAVFTEFSKAAAADAEAQNELAAAQHELDQQLSKEASKSQIADARAAVEKATATADETGLAADSLRQKYVNLVDDSSSAAKLQVVRTSDALSSNRISWIGRLLLVGLALGGGIGYLIGRSRDRAPARGRLNSGPAADQTAG